MIININFKRIYISTSMTRLVPWRMECMLAVITALPLSEYSYASICIHLQMNVFRKISPNLFKAKSIISKA